MKRVVLAVGLVLTAGCGEDADTKLYRSKIERLETGATMIFAEPPDTDIKGFRGYQRQDGSVIPLGCKIRVSKDIGPYDDMTRNVRVIFLDGPGKDEVAEISRYLIRPIN